MADDVLRLPGVVVPNLENLGVELPYSVVSSVSRRVEDAIRHVELKISTTEGDELFDIPRVQRRKSPLDERDGRSLVMHPRPGSYRRTEPQCTSP